MNTHKTSNNATEEIKSKISLSDIVQKYVTWDNKNQIQLAEAIGLVALFIVRRLHHC